ncbi:HAD family hydrolase [Actinokineospora cianjurensis]|uniref:Sugar-phosphatase n=1 Tax=Actinokineospora cianjurensis TaxID=585224 RepID=A0A421B3K5_9PSEU|nr:HAD family phosphatase [Actinokineospora cianjurensis]RLK58961.1 sugar-phosphatase [Actinokineospora cianjurensis]
MTLAFKAALFDMDGTLADSEPRSRWAWRKLFRTYGLALDDVELKTFSGRRGQDVLAERTHLFPADTTVDGLFDEAMGYWAVADVPSAVAVPGAPELVRAVHAAGVPAAIVSSGRRADVHGLLAELGLGEFFAVVVAAEDVTEGKPHPEGFLTACTRLGVSAEDVVVFEDAPAGVAAAKAAGAVCVAVTTTRPHEQLAAADLVVADFVGMTWPPSVGARP